MRNSRPNLIIQKNLGDIVVIMWGKSRVSVDIKNMSEWEQFQAVKEAILKMGIVFSRKIEKNVEKCLYS